MPAPRFRSCFEADVILDLAKRDPTFQIEDNYEIAFFVSRAALMSKIVLETAFRLLRAAGRTSAQIAP